LTGHGGTGLLDGLNPATSLSTPANSAVHITNNINSGNQPVLVEYGPPRAGPYSKNFLELVLRRFLILGKSWENIWQSTDLKLGNNNTIIITVINTFVFTSCWMLLRDVVVKS